MLCDFVVLLFVMLLHWFVLLCYFGVVCLLLFELVCVGCLSLCRFRFGYLW